ncbi:LysR family transcriptional regulator [Antarctobacter sp.]|uniref:LysR family transcriptional regulator n=1 Tax=Antarctobacter sp. TaxID=1872577 RepID=UPI003A8F1D7B
MALTALCELRSMGRAAEAMGMSQPAMSQLVAELERLLETPLFRRHAKGVDPMPSALDLLPVARRIALAAEEGAERIASRGRQEGGMVRVASTASATGALLDRVLPAFGASQPNVLVSVNTVIAQSLDASFSGDEYDVICCRERDVVPEGWQFQSLLPDDLVVMAGPTHPLASKRTVSMDDLARATWVHHQTASLARDQFDRLRDRLDWTDLKMAHVTSRIPLLSWTMLRDGTLLSLLPRSVVMPWITTGQLIELDVGLDLALAPIGYHWRADRSGPAARAFFQALSGACAPPKGNDET